MAPRRDRTHHNQARDTEGYPEMGLFTKLAGKAAAGAPDYPGEIGRLLGSGEHIIGWAPATPLACGTDKHARRHRRLAMAINIASPVSGQAGGKKVPEHQHLGGADGSAARSIPCDVDDQLTVAITDQQVTFCSFGSTMRDVRPTLVASFPRADVRWIAKTGRRDQRGAHVRFSFTDESFIDLAVIDHQRHASFFVAAAEIGR